MVSEVVTNYTWTIFVKFQNKKENKTKNVTTTYGDYIHKPVDMASMSWTTKRKP